MAEVIERQIKNNPEFDVYIYSEAEAVELIRENFGSDVLTAYHGLKPSAYRSDLFRYCALYAKGGVYMDTKIDIRVPLKELIRDSRPVLLKTDKKWCDGKGVSNGFMITPPKSELLLKVIREIVSSYNARSYKKNELDVTGPCLIGDVLDASNMSALRDSARCVCGEENGDFIIRCDDEEVGRSYPEYRAEQLMTQKEPHYKVLYAKGDIYW